VKIVHFLIVAVIALLSIAAGLAKVMQTPQEMEFLQGLGLSSILIAVFGWVQVIGGGLLVPKKTRMPGAILVTAAFSVSTVLLFIGGNLAFGLVSIIPVALAGVIICKSSNTDAGDAGSA